MMKLNVRGDFNNEITLKAICYYSTLYFTRPWSSCSRWTSIQYPWTHGWQQLCYRDAQPTGRYRIYRQQSIKVKPTMTYSCKSTWHIQLGQIFTQPICYSHSGILHKLHILQSFLTDAAVPTLTIKSTGWTSEASPHRLISRDRPTKTSSPCLWSTFFYVELAHMKGTGWGMGWNYFCRRKCLKRGYSNLH